MGNSKTINSRTLFKVAITTFPEELGTARPSVLDQRIIDMRTICTGTPMRALKRLQTERNRVRSTPYRVVIQEVSTKRFWKLKEFIELVHNLDDKRRENRLRQHDGVN